jgi:hypothetical protein
MPVHAFASHTLPLAHAMQLSPPLPHASFAPPETHVPALVQQPLLQCVQAPTQSGSHAHPAEHVESTLQVQVCGSDAQSLSSVQRSP